MANKTEDRNELLMACEQGNAEDLKQLLSKTKAWGQPVFTTEELLNAVIVPLIKKEKRFDGFYHFIHSKKTYLKQLEIDKKEAIDEDQILARENCIRAIIEHEKQLLRTLYPNMPSEEINKFVADKLLNNANRSPLFELLYVGPYSRILGVLTEELGVENINFLSRSKNSYTPMQEITRFTKWTHYHVLESYLCEYLKMRYDDKENDTLYQEIKNFFNTNYPSFMALFRLKMQEFSRVLENAKKQAEADLKQKHGDEFDAKKFNDQEDAFMDKFIPDAYLIQKKDTANIRESVGWGVFMAVFGTMFIGIITVPFFMLWYHLQKKQQPIKKETIAGVESILETNQSQKDLSGEDVVEGSLSKSGSYSDVKQLLTDEPVKTIAHKEKQPSEWRRTGTVSLREGNKVTVFRLKPGEEMQDVKSSGVGLRS